MIPHDHRLYRYKEWVWILWCFALWNVKTLRVILYLIFHNICCVKSRYCSNFLAVVVLFGRAYLRNSYGTSPSTTLYIKLTSGLIVCLVLRSCSSSSASILELHQSKYRWFKKNKGLSRNMTQLFSFYMFYEGFGVFYIQLIVHSDSRWEQYI